MNKFLTLLAALVLASEAVAQSPSPSPGPPDGNLLNRAPGFACWTVERKPSGGTASVADPKTTPEPEARKKKKSDPENTGKVPGPHSPVPVVRTTVVKTGSVFHLQSTGSSGDAEEKWCRVDLQATLRPDSPTPLISVPGNVRDTDYVDFSRSDFPDCSWVSRKNYVGLEQREDHVCLVFKDQLALYSDGSASGQEQPPRVRVTAYIDYYSRLPVVLIRDDTVWTYRFEMPPQSPLVIPDNVAAAMQQREQKIKELSLKPAKPF